MKEDHEDVSTVEDTEAMICIRWRATKNGVLYRSVLRMERGPSTRRMGEAFRDFGEQLIEWAQNHKEGRTE